MLPLSVSEVGLQIGFVPLSTIKDAAVHIGQAESFAQNIGDQQVPSFVIEYFGICVFMLHVLFTSNVIVVNPSNFQPRYSRYRKSTVRAGAFAMVSRSYKS